MCICIMWPGPGMGSIGSGVCLFVVGENRCKHMYITSLGPAVVVLIESVHSMSPTLFAHWAGVHIKSSTLGPLSWPS